MAILMRRGFSACWGMQSAAHNEDAWVVGCVQGDRLSIHAREGEAPNFKQKREEAEKRVWGNSNSPPELYPGVQRRRG